MRRAAARVAALMNDVAGWMFILCAAFITIDVLLRNFAGFSSSATTEITSYMSLSAQAGDPVTTGNEHN